MIARAFTLAVALLGVIPAAAAEPRTLVFDIGNKSCATWLSTEQTRHDGVDWILGYASGRNRENTVDRAVGSNTDAEGVTAEVKKVCEAHPSLTLFDAI